MEWIKQISPLLDILGGGPLAVAFVGICFMYYKSIQRGDRLVERILDMSKGQSDAMNELSKQIENVLRGRP